MNGDIKQKLGKVCNDTGLKWPDALPLVLMRMRCTPNKQTGLSPHKVLMGRPMRIVQIPAEKVLRITDDAVEQYCKEFSDVITSISQQVKVTTILVKDVQLQKEQ